MDADADADERDAWVVQTQICEKANRFDDACDAIQQVVRLTPPSAVDKLDADERALLSIAFKNSVGHRRAAWRALYTAEKKEQAAQRSRFRMARDYRKRLESELKDKCAEILDLLDEHLIPVVEDPESDVFYHKMRGDYYRYLAEIEVDDVDQAGDFVDKANDDYEGAVSHATVNLAATHPLRLGLVLNYSVFLHEQKRQPAEAYRLAQKGYEEALSEIGEVQDVEESRYKECSNMMRLLKENLKVWKGTLPPQGHV